MIRRILVGLDGTPASQPVAEMGVDLAKQYGAELVGLTVIDEPSITAAQPTGTGGSHYQARIVQARMGRATAAATAAADRFLAACRAAGVSGEVRTLAADPAVALLDLHEEFDITLLGRETRFRHITQDGPDDVLETVLRQSRRPVVVVPDRTVGGEAVVVAYDAGPAAVDALEAFAASGLGAGRPVSVVSVSRDRGEAERRAAEAARFLTAHGIPAIPRPVATADDEAGVIDAEAAAARAGLVVMGAYSRGRLREWYDRSTTTRLLDRPGRLLYLHHHSD